MMPSYASAQYALSATTLTDIPLTVPADSRWTGTIRLCNRGGTATTVRLSHAISGAADDSSQYLLYDHSLPANATISVGPLVLGEDDIVRAYAASANVTVTANGFVEY